MNLFTLLENIPTTPLFDKDTLFFKTSYDTLACSYTVKDIIFESFYIPPESDYHLISLQDAYSAILFEFTLDQQTHTFYKGPTNHPLPITYHAGSLYFQVRIPPIYFLKPILSQPQLFTNKISELSNVIPAFYYFDYPHFKLLNFQEQISYFQAYVGLYIPTQQNHFINYTLEKSLQPIDAPSLKHISTELNVSERYIRNLFKQQLGLTPKDVIQTIRLHQTLSLMLDYDQSITDAYVYANFYDHSHFNKFFKQQTSYSPTEFKRLIQQRI